MTVTDVSQPENDSEVTPSTPEEAPASPSLLRRNWHKWLALGIWLILLGVYLWYTNQHAMGPLYALYRVVDILQTPYYGPLLYVLLFALRPLVFFSASLLTVVAGSIFGPVEGFVYTIVASNVSAGVAYMLGHIFGRGLLESPHSERFVRRYAQPLRRNSFTTVLFLNLIFVPFDLINYAAGLLHIHFHRFMAATILGSVPGIIACVMLGASIHFERGAELTLPDIHPGAMLLSLLMFVVSLLFSRYLKWRTARRGVSEEA